MSISAVQRAVERQLALNAFRFALVAPSPERPVLQRDTSRPTPDDLADVTNDRLVLSLDLHTPDGVIPVHELGRGMFSRAYRENGGAGRVFSFEDSTLGSHDKQIAIDARQALEHDGTSAGHQAARHIPAIEPFGATATARVYTMPWYRAPLEPRYSPDAWFDLRRLRECQESEYPLECARQEGVTPSVVDALTALQDAASRYGEHRFDFSERNLAVDEADRLILLDPIFSPAARDRAHERTDAEDERDSQVFHANEQADEAAWEMVRERERVARDARDERQWAETARKRAEHEAEMARIRVAYEARRAAEDPLWREHDEEKRLEQERVEEQKYAAYVAEERAVKAYREAEAREDEIARRAQLELEAAEELARSRMGARRFIERAREEGLDVLPDFLKDAPRGILRFDQWIERYRAWSTGAS